MSGVHKSVSELLDEVKRSAVDKAGLPPQRNANPDVSYPLVPIYIGIDTDGKEIREQFLWRMGEPGVGPRNVAAKFCSELQLTTNLEKFVESQVDLGLKRFKGWQDLGGQKLVKLRVYVRRGDTVFKDVVLWDLNQPSSNPMHYAAAACSDLGLDAGWSQAISDRLQALVSGTLQAFKSEPHTVKLEPPVDPQQLLEGGAATEASEGSARYPRLGEYDPHDDWEQQQG